MSEHEGLCENDKDKIDEPWYKNFSKKSQKPGAMGNIKQGEATLDFFINVSCKFDLTTNSECVWVNNN